MYNKIRSQADKAGFCLINHEAAYMVFTNQILHLYYLSKYVGKKETFHIFDAVVLHI